MREVIRFVCEDDQCKDVPCMAYENAIAHAELHKLQSLNVETIEAYLRAQT